MSDERATTTDDPLWRLRWTLLGSAVVIVFALGVVTVELDRTWRPGLVAWGVLVGLGTAVAMYVLLGAATRDSELTPERERQFLRRRIVYSGAWLMSGVVAGWCAGLFDAPIVDIVLTIYVVLMASAFAVAWRRVRRRRTSHTG